MAIFFLIIENSKIAGFTGKAKSINIDKVLEAIFKPQFCSPYRLPWWLRR